MGLADFQYTAGVMGRSSLANDTPGARRAVSYIASDGTVTNEPQIQHRIYNGLGAASVTGGAYVIAYDGDEETNPKFILPVTAAFDSECCVTPAIVADATWSWVVTAGYVDALVEGTTDVVKDDFLKVTQANGASFITDTSTRSADSMAIATAGQTSATPTLTKIFILGGAHDVD